MTAMTEQEEAIRVLREALQKIIDMNVQYCVDKYGDASQAETMACVTTARKALAATATIQPAAAAEPVRYELRMRAPNGHCGDWHRCNKEFFDKFSAAPDIGDGFTYETRALYTAAPAQAATDEVQFLLPADLDALKRFNECAMDFDSGGHDMPKDSVRRLVEIGVLRPAGPGRHMVTSFGDYVLGVHFDLGFKLPLKTLAEYNAEAALRTSTPADDSQPAVGGAA